MKKLILILFAVAIASVNSRAQEPVKKTPPPQKSPAERAENMTKRLTKELNLSAEQQVKVKAIILKREQDRLEASKDLKEGNGKAKEELKTVFTPEQFQKFEAKEAEMKKKREEKRKNSPPPTKDAPQPPAPAEK